MEITYYILPIFLGLLFLFGLRKNSYDAFITGAKKGIEIALNVFPYLLAMIFATKLLSSSMFLVYLFKRLDIPYLFFVEGIFRPLSNNASLSILIEIFIRYGVDSDIGLVASVLQGATETSFYVITIYYGAVGIKKYPYSLWMAIVSDILTFCFCLLLFYYVL